MKRLIFIILLGVAVAAGFNYYQQMHKASNVKLPDPITYNGANNAISPSILPAEVNLKVPFTSQAPHANWEDPYGEFCEEASALMAAYYLQNKPIPSASLADQELLKVKSFEEGWFGYYKDTTAKETATILKEHFAVPDSKLQLVSRPNIQQIKEFLAAGKIVLVPAAGRMLPNPNYTAPGPVYHMIVIKGYTKDGQFITNDPGTRKGADFLFDFNYVMDAMHDWNGSSDIIYGDKVILVVG